MGVGGRILHDARDFIILEFRAPRIIVDLDLKRLSQGRFLPEILPGRPLGDDDRLRFFQGGLRMALKERHAEDLINVPVNEPDAVFKKTFLAGNDQDMTCIFVRGDDPHGPSDLRIASQKLRAQRAGTRRILVFPDLIDPVGRDPVHAPGVGMKLVIG